MQLVKYVVLIDNVDTLLLEDLIFVLCFYQYKNKVVHVIITTVTC